MVDHLLREKLRSILEEDLSFGDVTTDLLIEPDDIEAEVISRGNGIAAGIAEGKELLDMMGITVLEAVDDGHRVQAGDVLIRMRGVNKSILMAERSLLNILSRMCGIASMTAQYLEKARRANPGVRIAATRKTAPGLRRLDKKAVTIGGGDPHRINLHDAVLIKDNHIDAVGDLATAIARVRSGVSFIRKIEVEVSTPEAAMTAIESGVDVVMLDNMPIEEIKRTVNYLEEEGCRERVTLEASGNITFDNVDAVAATGVDVISIGSLTHSVKALDLTLSLVRP